MKKQVVVWMVVSSMLVSLTAMGQQRGFGSERGGMRFAGIGGFEKLKLTDEQKSKLQKLQKEFRVQDSVANETFRSERKALMEKRMKSFEGILTPAQKAEMKTITQKRDSFAKIANRDGRGFGRQGFGGRGFGGQGIAGRGATRPNMGNQGGRPQGAVRQGVGQNPMQARGFGQRPAMGRQPEFGRSQRTNGMQLRSNNKGLVNPEERIDKEVKEMTSNLNLTTDQAKKIKDIKLKYAKKEVDAYKKMQKRMDARTKKQNAPTQEIKSVLNEEQLKKLEAHRMEAPYSTDELTLGVFTLPVGEGIAQLTQSNR